MSQLRHLSFESDHVTFGSLVRSFSQMKTIALMRILPGLLLIFSGAPCQAEVDPPAPVLTVSFPHSTDVSSAIYSPDGKIIATGSGSTVPFSPEPDKTIRLWSARSGQLLKILSGHTAAVSS